MIKFRPFKSELMQVVAASDEFVLVAGLVLLYFLYKNQYDLKKSNQIGLIIIGCIALSLFKNFGVIIFLSITNTYKNFRKWFHKKIGVKKAQRQQRRIDRHKRREQAAKEKEEQDLIDKIFIGKLRPDQIMKPGQASIISTLKKVERPPKIDLENIDNVQNEPNVHTNSNFDKDLFSPNKLSLPPRKIKSAGEIKKKRKNLTSKNSFSINKSDKRLDTIQEVEEDPSPKHSPIKPRAVSR